MRHTVRWCWRRTVPALWALSVLGLVGLLGSAPPLAATPVGPAYAYNYDESAAVPPAATTAHAPGEAWDALGADGTDGRSPGVDGHFYDSFRSRVAPRTVRVASSGIDAAPMSTVRTIGRGEKVADLVNEAKGLTFTTGNEYAVVRLANGDRVLISGGSGGIELTTDVTLVYGHTHPYGVLSNGASPGDYAMLDALDQPFSYVIDNGEIIRFNRGGG